MASIRINLKSLLLSLILTFPAAGTARPVSEAGEEIAIPVKFLENREVALGLYPEGFSSAAVLTGVGFNLEEENFPPFRRLVSLLANQGIRGTFFLRPGAELKKQAARRPGRIEILARISSHNFEIAQNGPALFQKPETGPGVDERAGPSSLATRIEAGRGLLSSLGLEPAGYRGPAASADRVLLSRLEDMGYVYFCAAGGPDSSPAPSPDRDGNRLFPRPAAGLRIRQFSARLDPAVEPEAARREFEEISRRGGVFVYQVDLPGLREEGRLGNLKSFVDYLKDRNAWLCSLRQLGLWWTAREQVGIETVRDGETLVIVCDNPTRFLLKNARFSFTPRESPARYYRVEDREGTMYSSGIIPPEGFTNVTILPATGGGGGE